MDSEPMPKRPVSEPWATDEPNSGSQAWNRWIGCAPKGFGLITPLGQSGFGFLDVLEEPPSNVVSDGLLCPLAVDR